MRKIFLAVILTVSSYPTSAEEWVLLDPDNKVIMVTVGEANFPEKHPAFVAAHPGTWRLSPGKIGIGYSYDGANDAFSPPPASTGTFVVDVSTP